MKNELIEQKLIHLRCQNHAWLMKWGIGSHWPNLFCREYYTMTEKWMQSCIAYYGLMSSSEAYSIQFVLLFKSLELPNHKSQNGWENSWELKNVHFLHNFMKNTRFHRFEWWNLIKFFHFRAKDTSLAINMDKFVVK